MAIDIIIPGPFDYHATDGLSAPGNDAASQCIYACTEAATDSSMSCIAWDIA